MKVLLDENLPHRLRHRLGSHEVSTVSYMGWAGLKNGELLKAAEAAGFEVLVTGDQTLPYEQNLAERRLPCWFSPRLTGTFLKAMPP